MVELDQFRYRISGYDKPMAQIKNSLDLDNKQKRIEELEADMESPGFWDNPDKSQNAMKELKGLKDAFERYNELETGLDDVKTLIEMAEESNDQSLIPEIEEEITGLEDKMESLRIETLLSGEHDACDAILTLHAGAGGTESCDWCQMLFRMYTRWAESHGYTTETLDYLEGEEAGIKSVIIEIRGENAYAGRSAAPGLRGADGGLPGVQLPGGGLSAPGTAARAAAGDFRGQLQPPPTAAPLRDAAGIRDLRKARADPALTSAGGRTLRGFFRPVGTAGGGVFCAVRH